MTTTASTAANAPDKSLVTLALAHSSAPIREAGEMLLRMMAGYETSQLHKHCSPAKTAAYLDSIQELSALIADMLQTPQR